MKINEFFKDKKNIIMIVCVLLVAVLLLVHTIVTNNILHNNSTELQSSSKVNPRVNQIKEEGAAALADNTADMTENTVSTSSSETKPATTAATVPATTVKPAATKPRATVPRTTAPHSTVHYATEVRPESPADYKEQWDQGYLLALDNPDTSYVCAKVTLTEEDRDLLERLCYGEFGTGGFIGACLIAQCVKDAMCFDNIGSVEEVIRDYHYDGSVDMGTSEECRQAVRYIFDDNRDAVQHRLMYMYNPYMVQSDFHESQNFILSYAGVRFFDRWGN